MIAPQTPDRHTPLRIDDAHCTLRTSVSPESLTPQERYVRQRDESRDLFSTPTKIKPKVKHQVTANGNGMLAPHFVPSFVHTQDHTPPQRSPQGPRNVRYISIGSAWAVGGRVAAVPTQLQGIETGTGEVLASGTTAPLVDAAFAKVEAPDAKLKAHESRLALALDIDQAKRVLPVSPPASPRPESP